MVFERMPRTRIRAPHGCPRTPDMRAQLSGAGLGVVLVGLAVVVPAQELEVGEVGGAVMGPPLMWWGWQNCQGTLQPLAWQCPSRTTSALNCLSDGVRLERPRSRTSLGPSMTTRARSQSHSSRSIVAWESRPPVAYSARISATNSARFCLNMRISTIHNPFGTPRRRFDAAVGVARR